MRFPYSAESARKINESAGGGYEFYKEVGDATGPFAEVGYVEVNASGLDGIVTFSNGSQLGFSGGIDDPNVEFRVHFFVDARGGSFAVVHKRPVPDPVPIAKDDPPDPRRGEQVELSGAATMAIWTANLPLLKLLLEAGLKIDQPLDWDGSRMTALHHAAQKAKRINTNGATGSQKAGSSRAVAFAATLRKSSATGYAV